MHIGRHSGGVAADIDRRAIFDPLVQLATGFENALLNVGSIRTVAREGEIETRERGLLQCALPLDLVQEIAREAASAEEQPAATTRPDCRPLLNESTVRSDTRTGSDHDDVARGIVR